MQKLTEYGISINQTRTYRHARTSLISDHRRTNEIIMSVRNFVLVSRLEGDRGTYENRDKLCLCAEIAFAEVTQPALRQDECHRARKNSTDKNKRSRSSST